MKKIIVYYSYTGNTKRIANYIKEKLDCDILELSPRVPFSTDYDEVVAEYQNNSIDNKEVAINDININLDEYDEIIIGTPVWWYTMCPVVTTFLKQYDLSNKKVYMYATNAGWLGHTFKDFIKLHQDSTIDDCLNVVFSSTERDELITKQEEIDKWIDSINKGVHYE